jgi:Domain of unknown function (DUF4936)
MSSHLYTYYKLYTPVSPELYGLIKEFMGSMQVNCTQVRLRRRVQSGAQDTWMEVYEGVHEDFLEHYHAALNSEHFKPLFQLTRHEEWFDDVPSCA